uniref:Uncharacterized protein n=1 Tax=Heliothis virescens TaxID=7102 RepID=A0A2A4JBK7_HELVI
MSMPNDLEVAKGTLLASLQEKRNQILRNEQCAPQMTPIEKQNTHPTLLKELQAKQASFKLKRSGSLEGQLSSPMEAHNVFVGMSGNRDVINCSDQSNAGLNRRASASSIDPKQIEEEQCDQNIGNNTYGDRSKPKKKSVSFCDQVILVSTAEDQEDDSYIPNPILERINATHNPAYMSKHPANFRDPCPTPAHTPAQLHPMNQAINNAYYHRVPQTSAATTMPSNNYTTNRQYAHNMSNTIHSPYQSVPTNSPAYQSYHNPPTSYASSEYSSRYHRRIVQTTTPSHLTRGSAATR